ncbi:hypothetical protein GOP47_0015623 [Adiantum capillus-veneris]|uniref:non-specific serine/threonine protein kinase n=1 Tax=Adiantum capillus-veneris TaxID=13818 RepID=A0A9D4ZCT2_ADICA|nr:hypothetical protein GOP47_0015623 [Adiantum capillus-veneris]
MQSLYILLTLLIMDSSSSGFAFASSTSERDALLGAMVAWKVNFSSWVGDDPCINWQGVRCDSDGRVTYLNLSNTGIVGPVPQEIASLQDLTVLDLCNPRYNARSTMNAVSGDLSPLQGLIHLQNLNVSFNNITLSSFPSAIFNLTNLVSLRIDNLRIGGPLPKELVNLTKLEYMYLANNSLTGPIPIEYGRLMHLREISLWNNNLNSKIPPEFGNLTNLTYINFHECNLYGGLPPELGKCKKMRNISLYGNSLTGIVPDSWKNMTQLSVLWLHRNRLTKYLPEWLPSLPNLYNVSLDYNLFYGSVPNFSNASVKIMSITCNYFSGATPTGPANLVLNTSGNCFDPINNNEKIRCQQDYFDCGSFFNSLPNGACPRCPSSQSLEDANTCVCTLSTTGDIGGSTGGGSNRGKLIGSIVGVGGLLLVLASLFYVYRRYRKPVKQRYLGYASELWDGPEGIVRYNIQDIVAATDDFDKRHQIGVGGFGRVFHAVLGGREVAVKLAHTSSIQSTAGFRNELVLLSRLHHVNLVHLLGFCEAEGIQILVYEYMPNGNLHTMLFKNTITLDWLTRLDIALGIAHGLEYLHSFADPPVIHRDVKLSNVLLDDNLVAKLSDFGISKVAQEFETQMATRPAGTAGYIDPQYVLTEQLTSASDVYGFGMVLLELISGQKCIDNARADGQNLIEWVEFTLQTGKTESIVDPRLGDRYPKQIYQDIIRLALDCAAFKSGDRPSMKVVVAILDGCRWSVARDLNKMNHSESFQDNEHVDEEAVSCRVSRQESNNVLSESTLVPR